MKTTILPLVAVFLIAPAASQAAVMVSNLNDTQFSTFPVGTLWAGNRFITDGSAPSFQLDNVTLSMATATGAGGGFFVAIYSHGTGAPGSLLHTLLGTADPATEGQYTYTSPGFSLAPNTSYWVVAGVQGAGGTYPWKVAGETFSYTGPWQIPVMDTHITSFPTGGNAWNSFPNDGFPRLFSVSATPVPEPTAASLLIGAGTLVLAAARKRKRN